MKVYLPLLVAFCFAKYGQGASLPSIHVALIDDDGVIKTHLTFKTYDDLYQFCLSRSLTSTTQDSIGCQIKAGGTMGDLNASVGKTLLKDESVAQSTKPMPMQGTLLA